MHDWSLPLLEPGAIPGTIVAPEGAVPSTVKGLRYNSARAEDLTEIDPAAPPAPAPDSVLWLDVQGLGDVNVLRALADALRVHPLALEDLAHANQRAKVDVYPGAHVILLRALHLDGSSEQVGLILAEGLVVTFQERPEIDVFSPVRRRIHQHRGRVRERGPDYLAYVLIDTVVDGYAPALEELGDRIEALEENVLEQPGPDTFHRIHELRRELINLRRQLRPVPELLRALVSMEESPFNKPTRVFLRDTYDHALRALDLVETFRELVSSLMDAHLSQLSFRMNQVMQVLAVVGAIFLPLSFIAGFYGMNFDPGVSPLNMPETKWYYGYPVIAGLMAALGVALLWVFRRRGWLGTSHRH